VAGTGKAELNYLEIVVLIRMYHHGSDGMPFYIENDVWGPTAQDLVEKGLAKEYRISRGLIFYGLTETGYELGEKEAALNALAHGV
jgi:hypothetical protein